MPPVSAAPLARYRRVPRWLLTDLDGTLTTRGALTAAAVAAVERVAACGVRVAVVTGRPAAWGDALARLLPLHAVVAENGAVTFARAAGGDIVRTCAVPDDRRDAVRAELFAAVEDAIARCAPGARLAADQRYREIDVAVDWNEQVHLEVAAADRLAAALRAAGFAASRSSVHVNVGPAGIDKLTAARALVGGIDPSDVLYVGDALNDAPMFGGFPHTVGVANVADVWGQLEHRPRYVTDAAEGAGFVEVADAIARNAAARYASRRRNAK